MKTPWLFIGAVLAAAPVLAQPDPTIRQASESYVIVPLDTVRMRIVGEDETLTEARVAADGKITLPYIGSVSVADMTVTQAREKIYALYDADYFVNPQIDFAVVGYKQRRVNVTGMVNTQGFVVFPPEEELTLLGAISAAGGWRNDRLADRHNVKLTRTMPDGTTTTFQIDATKINQNDWVLRDGDLVIVGERWM